MTDHSPMMAKGAPCGRSIHTTGHLGSSRGFTLLELLIVIFIIGIVLGIAVVNLPSDDDRTLRREAERFDALLDLASETAMTGGEELALEIEPHGYRFLVARDHDWQIIDTPPLQARQLPEDIVLDVLIDGIHLEIGQNEGDEAGRLYILSSGEMTPFELTLSRPKEQSASYRIVAEIDGQHRLERLES